MKIVYITGSPGTGKSTVAPMVADFMHAEHLELGTLALEKKFIAGYDKERRTPIVDMKKLGEYLKELISSKNTDFVLNSHFCIKPSVKADTYMFVLRLEPFKLAERLRAKSFPEKKVNENMWAEILDSCLQEALACKPKKIHEIDTTDKEAGAIVEEIIEVIEGRKNPSIGIVNWLSIMEKIIKSAEDKL